jgi:FkbM family methyltransferase
LGCEKRKSYHSFPESGATGVASADGRRVILARLVIEFVTVKKFLGYISLSSTQCKINELIYETKNWTWFTMHHDPWFSVIDGCGDTNVTNKCPRLLLIERVLDERGMTNEECVRLLYRHILGREAEADGLSAWTALADQQGSIKVVLEGLIHSPEFAARMASPKVRDLPQATLLAFREELGRDLLIVDVGAQRLNFEEHVYTPVLGSELNYRIIGFEPLKHRLDERLKTENNPRLTLYPNFVGDGSELTFYINNIDATSSLLPLNEKFNKVFDGLDSLETVRVESVKTDRLDTLLSDISMVDFLKLDIQGFELDALRGAEAILKRTNVVHCEVEFAKIYAGQPLFSEVELHLRERGFELIDIVHPARSAYRVKSGSRSTDRLIWAEAVFFRGLGHKEASASRFLAQALIAWFVYRKPGLAEHLFERYDAIAGTHLARSLQWL